MSFTKNAPDEEAVRLLRYYEGLAPVSYTHLDVYKRQPCNSAHASLPFVKIRSFLLFLFSYHFSDKMCIRDRDDDTAVILMVDSNVQRENVLPSEKARAYKIKLDAMKRQGERTDLTSAGIRQKLSSVQKIADDAGEGKTKIQQYIKINDLIPELLEMVDGNEIKFNPAYELAFLRPEEQAVLYDILQAEEVTPSLSQAQRLKRASQEGRLSEQDIAAIMREEKAQTRDTGKVTLPAKEIEQFFPKSYTPEQKKKVIVKLLASWARQRGEQVR